MLARELSAEPTVLVAAQPTRGLDVGAIEFIGQRLRAAADRGIAVLLISSELEEILALADRIVVIHAGRIRGEMARADADIERIGLLMGGSCDDVMRRRPRRAMAVGAPRATAGSLYAASVARRAGPRPPCSCRRPVVRRRRCGRALLDGSIRSPGAWGLTLTTMAPLLLVAIGAIVATRAGLINIGQEGQLLIGACFAAYLAVRLPGPGPLVLVATLLVRRASAAGCGPASPPC